MWTAELTENQQAEKATLTRLTEKAIAKLPHPAKGNKLYFDDEVRGLAVRITAAA